MLEEQVNIDYIIRKINEWYSNIKLNNSNSLYNINNFSENFCRDLMNLVNDWKLKKC